LGVSPKLASKLETGKPVAITTITKLATILGITPEDLMDVSTCPYCGSKRKE
jgi:transcriptional regulator with XRE-family HTH domain